MIGGLWRRLRRRTGRAAELLADWPRALRGFRQVVPRVATAAAAQPTGDEPAAEETAVRA
jgi:hypothetical protein